MELQQVITIRVCQYWSIYVCIILIKRKGCYFTFILTKWITNIFVYNCNGRVRSAKFTFCLMFFLCWTINKLSMVRIPKQYDTRNWRHDCWMTGWLKMQCKHQSVCRLFFCFFFVIRHTRAAAGIASVRGSLAHSRGYRTVLAHVHVPWYTHALLYCLVASAQAFVN